MKTLPAKILLFNCLFIFCVDVLAQNNLPPVYEIKNDTVLTQYLDSSYWQILEDKDGKLAFEQVIKPPFTNQFHYNKRKTSGRDFSPGAHWLRYVLKNTMDHDAKICFGFTDTYEESDFHFINEKGKVTHKVNGIFNRWSKLSGLKEYRIIPVELKPGETTIVYNRVYYTNHVFTFGLSDKPVVFNSTEKVMQKIYEQSQTNYFNAIHDIFIVGVLAFASLFSFMFFIIVREKVYLYFSLYLFTLCIGRFNINAEMYDLFFREHPYFFPFLFNMIWLFPIFFLTHFVRYLLNTKQHLPRWDKFLFVFNTIYALTYGLLAIVFFVSVFNPFLQGIIVWGQIVLTLSVMVTFLISIKWFKHNKVLVYFVLPLQCTWCIGQTIVNFSQSFNVTTIPWLQGNWFGVETILLCGLVISFSWILLNRFGELKKQIVQKELEKEIERSRLIENQKIELEEQVTNRTADLKRSLHELKSTQAQLIQSEKMASLGELTAGVAHEIQNPLNFVNNFSDVNKELLTELKEEADKGNIDEVKTIANDVIDNEEKINHHGKRADAIVKSMLQHSKQTKGVKEPSDINALCDEYLRLSYHGMRARDKSFNATLQTNFDSTIGKINIVLQDIGRVLLNLFNNAFYATNEKKKANDIAYVPVVTVVTKKLNSTIEIKVSDNGNGISQNIIDKIFQPFFTTKPTGEGTGLGLSLAYDIITKEHNGSIKVESKEGEGSEFTVQLPNTM